MTTMTTSRRSTMTRSRTHTDESEKQRFFPDLSENDMQHIYCSLFQTLSTPQVSLFGPPRGGIPLVRTCYTHAQAHTEDPTQYVLFRYLRALLNTSLPKLELYYFLIDAFIASKKLPDSLGMQAIQSSVVRFTVMLLGTEPGLTVWDHGMKIGGRGGEKKEFPEHLGRKWGAYGKWDCILGLDGGVTEEEFEAVFAGKVQGICGELGIVIA